MPYGQSPWSQVGDAMTGVGQSMSNVVMAQQQGRLRQQQFLAQQAMEQAYYRMAQEREAREAQAQGQRLGMEQQRLGLDVSADQRAAASASRAMEQSQRIGRLQGVRSVPDPMMLVRDPQSAAQLFGDLRSAGVIPQGQADIPAEQLQALVAAALRAQATQAMASSPAGAAHLVDPVQGGAYPMLDPITMQQLAPGFVSPYQQRMGDLRDREVGIRGQDEARKAAADAATQQFRDRKLKQDLYLGQGRVLAPIAAGVQNRSAAGEPKNVDVGAANDVFQQLGRAIFDKDPPQAQGQIKQPKSQAEYDALQPGDIYIDTDGQTKRKK